MLISGILPVLPGSTRIAECNVGQEVAVSGLVFCNSMASVRTVVMSLFRQVIGSAQTITVDVPPKTKVTIEKAVGLQPGDHLDVVADLAGVSLLWTVDVDTGANPVATGFTIRGQHSNIANYAACDIVFKNGASYVAIRNNTAKDPETETADWMLLLDGSNAASVKDEIVAGAPVDMNTLNKISAAVGNDPEFAENVAAALSLKVNGSTLAAVAFTGNFADLTGIKKLAIRRLFFSRELA